MEKTNVTSAAIPRVYAGVGSRKTPKPVLHVMAGVAVRLTLADIVLRSGGADGADTAFEWGCDQVNPEMKQVLLPWPGFNGRQSPFDQPTEAMMEMAAHYHPAWQRCSAAARKLHARNCGQILGPDLDTPARVVICWTPDGGLVGGTAQALRLASDHRVPVINLGAECWRDSTAADVAHIAQTFIRNNGGFPTLALRRVLNKHREDCPAGAVMVDRSTKWGNPFVVGRDGSRLAVVVKYKHWLLTQTDLIATLDELRGRDLCCWCAPKLCHANVLMPMANRLN